MLESHSAAYSRLTCVSGHEPLRETTLCDSASLVLLVESHRVQEDLVTESLVLKKKQNQNKKTPSF